MPSAGYMVEGDERKKAVVEGLSMGWYYKFAHTFMQNS
jgi:hypothetical protein